MDKVSNLEFQEFWKTVPRLTTSNRKEWLLAARKEYPDRGEQDGIDSVVFEAKIKAIEARYGKIRTPVWNEMWLAQNEKEQKDILWDAISSKNTNEAVDPYKMFPLKKNAEEQDPKYGFRSIIVFRMKYKHSSGQMRDQEFAVMFPPITTQTTENRYEFLRHLDEYVKDLEKNGAEILGVHPKGHPEYEKYLGKAKKSNASKVLK